MNKQMDNKNDLYNW